MAMAMGELRGRRQAEDPAEEQEGEPGPLLRPMQRSSRARDSKQAWSRGLEVLYCGAIFRPF